MSKQMLELADLIESDQIDLDNIGTHNRNLIVSALRSSAESAPTEALKNIKQLVLTNRTHSVLDQVRDVCDSALAPSNDQLQTASVSELATKLLDFIDNQGPSAMEWKAISDTAEALRKALSQLHSRANSSPQTSRDPMMAAVASLAAAISLLERTPKAKKAAPSDKMFNQMLDDYRKALANARDALRSQAGSAPQPSSGHGCKRAGGFIDSGCTALCDCHITLALSRSQAVSAPQPPAGYQKLPDGTRCRCPKMWQDGNGGYWCCLVSLSRPQCGPSASFPAEAAPSQRLPE